MRSTGLNGSFLNLLIYCRLGSPAWCLGSTIGCPDVMPTVRNLPRLPGRPFGVATAPDLPTQSQLDRICHERELWKEVWNCGMLENGGDETNVALKIRFLVMMANSCGFSHFHFWVFAAKASHTAPSECNVEQLRSFWIHLDFFSASQLWSLCHLEFG